MTQHNKTELDFMSSLKYKKDNAWKACDLGYRYYIILMQREGVGILRDVSIKKIY